MMMMTMMMRLSLNCEMIIIILILSEHLSDHAIDSLILRIKVLYCSQMT